MRVAITISKEELKKLVLEKLAEKFEGSSFNPINVKIETKSQQNYKSEWEDADYRATYNGEV
jgi:hypothetical protein